MSKNIENRDPSQSNHALPGSRSRSASSQFYMTKFSEDSLEENESNDDMDHPSATYGPDTLTLPPWEIGLEAWAAFGYEDLDRVEVASSVQYIDTSVGQRTEGHQESKTKDVVPGLVHHVYQAVECTDSIGSISSCAEAGESVTSFTSVYEEIRNCEDDVGKISKLLELDRKASVHTITVPTNHTKDSSSDSSTAGPSSTKDSKNSKKKQNKLLGSLQTKASNSNTHKKLPCKQRQNKRSLSPKHKLIVCDGKVGLAGFEELETVRDDKSPYSCDFFDAKHQPPRGKQYHEVFVTEKEYKLIQSVIPPPPKPNAQILTPDATECQRTLFGWVAFGSSSNSPTTTMNTNTNTPSKIPLQFCRSRTKLGEFTTVSDTDLRHKSSCPAARPKDTKGTQTAKKSVEFVDNIAVEVKIEGQGQGQEFRIQSQEGESTSENCFQQVVKNLVGSLQGAIAVDGSRSSTSTTQDLASSPSQEQKPKIDRQSLETIGRNMCADVFAASETSVVLVNTVFKDIVLGSDVSVSLASSPKFQDFITSSNEMDALEKAAEIYASAAKNIYEYLHSARNSQIPNPNNSEAGAAAQLNSSRSGTKVVIVGNKSTESKRGSGTSSPTMSIGSKFESEPGGIKSPTFSIGSCAPIERQVSNLSNIWSFAPELHPEKFEMSLSSRPGILMETIDCNKWQFSISYTGSPDRINLLGTATREKAEPVFLNPQCLLEMVDRNASFASGRLTTSKYYMSRVSEKIGKLVQDFLTGKYAKPTTKYTAHLITKFRSQNVFSGVLFQISVSFVSVCKRIQSSIEKAMRLDDALRCPRLPGLKLIFDENNSKDKDKDSDLPIGAKMQMREAIQDLSFCMEEIDSILTCGKNSLAALSAGVKVKKSYKNMIKLLCDAVKQLEFGHDVDFGTVIMSLACNAAVIQSLSDIVPTVDIEIRSRILSNLGHLNWGAGEVVKLAKRISLLSSFIASKSFDKLSKYNQIQAAKKKRKRQKKAAKNSAKENQEKNGSRSMQSTLERIVEQRRLEEARRQEELRQQLGIAD